MTPKLAASRACSAPRIEIDALKTVCRFDTSEDDEYRKMFWEVIESFSYADRALLVKFTTGRSRLAPGDRMSIRSYTKDDNRMPTSATCSNETNMPVYSTKEIMETRLLTAVRMCGDIDGDGRGTDFPDEDGGNFDSSAPVEEDVSDDEDANVVWPSWQRQSKDQLDPSEVKAEDIGQEVEKDHEDQDDDTFALNFQI